MKFSCSVNIKQSKEKVAQYFADPTLLHHFQDGFKSKTLISGVEGEKGAKSTMVYEKLELLETILENNLPDEFHALYEHKHMTNTMRVNFETLADGSTEYTSEIDYTKFNGFMIKLIAKLFPGMFRKQVLKWMLQFKDYCENN
ncbi:MAG: SRPBCC family protein [Bacteroidia bacterium]|nr:SRPBCC family protein [Bacteroidia bacterium]NND52557.1 SRPBCC family protein [Flavobacteriaceae bacterium]